MISLIAAIGKNRELGKDNKLLFSILEDMEFFRQTTMGHKVLMGRKTWESLPGKLAGRENIVVSRHPVEGADEWVKDLERFLQENQDTEEEIFVIGGGMVYFEALPYAKQIYLTEVEEKAPEADTFFPMFDRGEYDREVIREGKAGDLRYVIAKYGKKEVK